MRLYWMHVWRSPHFQRAGEEERRLIEIRFSLARKLHSTRRRHRVTQLQLAQRLGVAQSSISRVERASNRVSLDIAVRALIHLGCPDAEIAASFNVAEEPGVQCLRRRAAAKRPFAPRPSDPAAPRHEHRFLRKGSEWLPRLK
jgi:transcriptional regulator with XRE-family HTH domain